MTIVFEGCPKFGVTEVKDGVLIRVIDVLAEEAVTIAMTPAQARNLAQGIIAAAEKAEARA